MAVDSFHAPLHISAAADKRLRAGHLWLYSNEIDNKTTPLKSFQPGQVVEVKNPRGRALGLAYINPNTLLCARLLSRDAGAAIDLPFFVERIGSALALREKLFSQPFYRLVYSDSDLLPGLIVDRFADILVVQVSSAGMEAQLQNIVDALDHCLQPKGILLRNDHSARQLEQLPPVVEALGEVPDSVELTENNTRFLAPIRQGQKTGWFYDHRQNRAYLQTLSQGKRVLDVFSYTGAWALQAAQAGASEVICVDSSAQALELASENAALNRTSDRVRCLRGKAVDVMKELIADKQKFDIVVLDPPAFIKRRKDSKAGEAAYHHINELAVRLLSKGGTLVSASCSMHLPRARLMELMQSASRKHDRLARTFHVGSQGPDHPIHPSIPQTEYLKALFTQLDHPSL